MRASHAKVRKIAEQEDKSAIVILSIMSVAAIVSLAAIILELSTVKELTFSSRMAHYAFTGATVFGTWCLVATLFTFHYARIYYRSPIERRALRFPDNEENPDYWDFLIFLIYHRRSSPNIGRLSHDAFDAQDGTRAIDTQFFIQRRHHWSVDQYCSQLGRFINPSVLCGKYIGESSAHW